MFFEGPEPGTLVQFFKDSEGDETEQRADAVSGKGVLNNRISEYLMSKLNEIGVPTHFMRRLNMREQLVRQVEIIPLTIVMRNVAAGSFAKRFGLPEGTILPRSIIEFYYKHPDLSSPMVTEEHITAFGWANPYELDEMVAQSLRINDYLSGLFLGIGLRLVDFRLEYGRAWDNDDVRIVLADEITPDSCRLWDIRTNEKMDRDRLAEGHGPAEDAYREVARRLGVLFEGIGGGPTISPLSNVTTINER